MESLRSYLRFVIFLLSNITLKSINRREVNKNSGREVKRESHGRSESHFIVYLLVAKK
jgi:hypothetical protein